MAVCSHLWTWNLFSFHSVNWVINLSPSRSTFMSHVTPLSLSKNTLSTITLCSTSWSQYCQVFYRVARCSKGSWKFTSAIKTTFVSVPFELVLWLNHLQHSKTLFWVLCRRCGIHHGPPSTRLFLSTPAHHLWISLRNKLVPLGLYASMIDSLTFDIDSHHWPLIEIFDWVFDIKSSIHT